MLHIVGNIAASDTPLYGIQESVIQFNYSEFH